MILVSAGHLWLLALAAWIVFLHFLHSRRERHDVAYVALWEGLPDDSRARAARLRVRWNGLIVLQLFVLAAVVLALAGPALVTTKPSLASLAIVLDGSASIHGRSASGTGTADLVRSEALAVLDRYTATPIAVLELSSSPRVLAPLSEDPEEARRAIAAWEPTWFADGTEEDLRGLLAGQGGAFERVVLLTDHPSGFSLPGLDVAVFSPGENVALTAFSVREDPRGTGAIAFVRVRNDTSSYREAVVRLSDGAWSTRLSALLSPGEEEAYVLPFPMSLGPVFTAAIEGGDAFPADDSRVFSLARRTEWTVRVVGEIDRYLRAALTSVGGVRFLEADDPTAADIIVACGVALPADVPGSVFVIHGSLSGVVEVGEDEERSPGLVAEVAPGDPILESVDPANLVVLRSPGIEPRAAGVAVLSSAGEAILWRAELPGRRVVLLAPDPIQTNLPLTVDFPILVRNILYWLSLSSLSAPPHAATVGAAIPFAPYGLPQRLEDPSGRVADVAPASFGFLAKWPGIYRLTTTS
ncbi:MAG: VWA domain-containing protein, partial [Candidatus Bipolaricaulis sp.]|nr:VWA domain-containing protein [Candidatus Bipolaricaulis sp.]